MTQRYKVEWEGELIQRSPWDDNPRIRLRRTDGDVLSIKKVFATLIVPPEPVWQENDVLLVSGVRGMGPCLIWRKHSSWLSFDPTSTTVWSSEVSRAWADGRVTRLLPEVTQ